MLVYNYVRDRDFIDKVGNYLSNFSQITLHYRSICHLFIAMSSCFLMVNVNMFVGVQDHSAPVEEKIQGTD